MPLYNGNSSETPVVAYLKSGAILTAERESGSWFRIGMPDNRFGWIPSEKVEISLTDEAHSGGEDSPMAALELLLNMIPPFVDLDTETLHEAYELDHLPIAGTVRDDNGVQYVYILVNNNKVFYKTGHGSSGKYVSQLTFSCDVPLEEGQNVVSVVARDDQELLSSKSFVITRK